MQTFLVDSSSVSRGRSKGLRSRHGMEYLPRKYSRTEIIYSLQLFQVCVPPYGVPTAIQGINW